MKTIFVTGTAGSGKSLLTSKIREHRAKNGSFAAVLNLDPGVIELPYSPDVDARDYVDITSVMKKYGLGPNGALVMASDLIATKIDEIRYQVEEVNPDYLIVDTPGQIELFAYRASGPFLAREITRDEKACIFLFDGALVNTPVNFVSMALLATSIRLRLNLPSVNVLTKKDIIEDKLGEILGWSTSIAALDDAIASGADGETYSLVSNVLRGLNLGGFAQGIIPVSNTTGDGMSNLEVALSRIISLGEEVE